MRADVAEASATNAMAQRPVGPVVTPPLILFKEISDKAMISECGILVNASRAIFYGSENEDFAIEARAIAEQFRKVRI